MKIVQRGNLCQADETIDKTLMGQAFAVYRFAEGVLNRAICTKEDLQTAASGVLECYSTAPAEGWIKPPTVTCQGQVIPPPYKDRWFDKRRYGAPPIWHVKGAPVVTEDNLAFDSAESFQDFMDCFTRTYSDMNANFTDATFDYLKFGLGLDDKRNLVNRLEDIHEAIISACDEQSLREALGQFDVLLRDADRLSLDEGIEEWAKSERAADDLDRHLDDLKAREDARDAEYCAELRSISRKDTTYIMEEYACSLDMIKILSDINAAVGGDDHSLDPVLADVVDALSAARKQQEDNPAAAEPFADSDSVGNTVLGMLSPYLSEQGDDGPRFLASLREQIETDWREYEDRRKGDHAAAATRDGEEQHNAK